MELSCLESNGAENELRLVFLRALRGRIAVFRCRALPRAHFAAGFAGFW